MPIKSIILSVVFFISIGFLGASPLPKSKLNKLSTSMPLRVQNQGFKPLFSQSSCLIGNANLNKPSVWYVGEATIEITNKCATEQPLTGVSVSFTSQDESLNPINVNKFDAWWVNGTECHLVFVKGSGNTIVGSFSTANGHPVIKANQKIIFNGGFSLNGIKYDGITAQKTFAISGESPVDEYGSMNVMVDTTALDCTSFVCKDITVLVRDVNGVTVGKIVVPKEYIGKVYSKQIDKLLVNRYTISASGVDEAIINFIPSNNPSVEAKYDTPVQVIYKKSSPITQTGKIKISLNQCSSDYTGAVEVQVLDTKQSNLVVYRNNLQQGTNITTPELPVSSDQHSYAVSVQGIANPSKGEYCLVNGLLPVSVIAKQNNPLDVVLSKVMMPSTLTFAINGMEINDKASIRFEDATHKYVYVAYSGLINANSYAYKFESGLTIAYSVQASESDYSQNPIMDKQLVNGSSKINVGFEKNTKPKVLAIFWCGFSGDFCGQSNNVDDVNPLATHVILAFANTKEDGSVFVDEVNWPTKLIEKWQASGKKVIISVGGKSGHWRPIFNNPENFANSVKKIIEDHKIDGVDLDTEYYAAKPQEVSFTIRKLREVIGKSKLIMITPEIVGVYQQVAVPDKTTANQPWNFWVPVIKDSIDLIDYVQPQFYNNNYGDDVSYVASIASSLYMVNGYINWLNKNVGIFDKPNGLIPDFSGVPANKLVIGVMASEVAGIRQYYFTPAMIESAFTQLKTNYKNEPIGIMMWDSNWDKENNYTISGEAAKLLKIRSKQ